jgi:hypothetical protein
VAKRGSTEQCKDQKNERQKHQANVHKIWHRKLKVDNYKPH